MVPAGFWKPWGDNPLIDPDWDYQNPDQQGSDPSDKKELIKSSAGLFWFLHLEKVLMQK